MKRSSASLVWMRLRSVPLIAVSRKPVVRAFVATLAGRDRRVRSLNDLEPEQFKQVRSHLDRNSNDALEHEFLEFVHSKISIRGGL
jgi:hypothetical protein